MGNIYYASWVYSMENKGSPMLVFSILFTIILVVGLVAWICKLLNK